MRKPLGKTQRAVGKARRALAGNVRAERARRGWSQEALAEKSGVHHTYLSAIERASANCSIDIIESIANALQVPVLDLLRPAPTEA